MKLVFATNNQHKIKEISDITPSSVKLLSLTDAGVNEDIPEDEPTLEGNAMFKARYVHSRCGLNVFADDTGLEVYSLRGAPGVHSARYAGESKNPSANIDKLMSALKDKADRRARFRTVIALILDNKEYLFEGIVEGEIIPERRGHDGFGYDPVFVPDGFSQTFAEMSLDEKNRISHRANAFSKLLTFLSEITEKQ